PSEVPWYRGTAATLAILGLPFLVAAFIVAPWKAHSAHFRSPLTRNVATTGFLAWRPIAIVGVLFFVFFGDRLGIWFPADAESGPGLDPYFVRIVMTAGFNIILAVSL